MVAFKPRFGLAWSAIGPKPVLRGGVGLFTDLSPGTILDLYTTNFPQVTSFNLPSGGVAFNEAGSGATLLGLCNSAFQTAYNSGGTLGTLQSAAPAGFAGPNLQATNSKNLNPKYVEWNLELQRALGSRTVVSVYYVASRGH